MKRFLSIMLTVMLVLSSFVMVSATEDTFSVIKVTADKAETVAIDLETGYYEISADVYVTADVAEPKFEATLEDTYVAEGTIDTAKADQWQTVKFELVNADADVLKFTVTAGTMYVNNIKVDKAYSKTLVYEENFDYYKIGEDVSFLNVTATSDNYAAYNNTTTSPQSSFKVAANVGDKAKVGVIDYPRYHTEDEKGNPLNTTYKYSDDRTLISPPAYDGVNEGYEYYYMNVPTIDADHVIIEFDLYNAASTLTTDTYSLDDKSKILDKLRFSVIRNDANNVHSFSAPSFTIDSTEIKSWGRNETGGQPIATGNPVVDPQKWNKVVYELKKETVDSTVITTHTVNYGGSKVENTTYGAYANFGKIVFNVDQVYGGKFYIDDLKVFVIDEVANGYVERYAENFDREAMVLGQKVDGYTYYEGWVAPDPNNLTFTVDSTYDENNNPAGKGHTGNDSKYGRIYNKSICNATAPTRYLDDGVTRDEDVVSTSVYSTENFYNNIYKAGIGVAKVGDVKKTRLTFKYYLTGSAVNSSGKPVETLMVGFSRNGVKHIADAESLRFKISETTANIGSDSENANGNHYQGIKKWIPVTIDITSECKLYNSSSDPRFNHVITYTTSGDAYGYTFTKEISTKNYYDPSMLGITVEEIYGGIAYIDDIKVETNFYDAADFDILRAKENVAYENVLTKSADVKDTEEEFVVTTVSFGGEKDSVNIYKMPGNTGNVQVVTAVYKDNVLHDAVVTPVTTPLNAFAENNIELAKKINLPSEVTKYQYKVFVFNSAEGLKPLADMLSGTESLEIPAE